MIESMNTLIEFSINYLGYNYCFKFSIKFDFASSLTNFLVGPNVASVYFIISLSYEGLFLEDRF